MGDILLLAGLWNNLCGLYRFHELEHAKQVYGHCQDNADDNFSKESIMSGIIGRFTSLYHVNSEKRHNRPFLEAAMAACAVVAASEGEVTFSERIRVDQIMETLEKLKIFDPHEGVNLFNQYTDMIIASPKQGHEQVLSIIKAQAVDHETAELLVHLCLAVSQSDGKTSLIEHIEIVTLCGLIDVDPDKIGLDTQQVIDNFAK